MLNSLADALADFASHCRGVLISSLSSYFFICETLLEKFVLYPLRCVNYNFSLRHYTVIQLPITYLKLTEDVRKPSVPILSPDQAEWVTEMDIRYRFITKNNIEFHVLFYDKKDAALFIMFFGGSYAGR